MTDAASVRVVGHGSGHGSKRLDRATAVLLALLTAAFCLAGAAAAVAVPLFQGSDESAHLDMLRFQAAHPLDLPDSSLRIRDGVRDAVAEAGLAEGGPLSYDEVPAVRPGYAPIDERPTATLPSTRCVFGCQQYHYGHPPLYYELLAPVTVATNQLDVDHQVLVLRLVGVLLAAPIVPLAWYAGVQVWGRRSRLPVATAAVVALFGPVVVDVASVNNNSLVVSLGAATLALSARVVRGDAHTRHALLLGLVVGAGLLTKAQFLALAPVAGLSVLLGMRAMAPVLAFAVPAAVGSGWWLRNLLVDGSLIPAGSEILQPAAAGPWNDTSFPGFALQQGDLLVRRALGSYGDRHGEVAAGVIAPLLVLTAALAVAWLWRHRRRRPTLRGAAPGVVLLAFAALLVVAALQASLDVYREAGEVRGLAGRYVYPALLAFAVAAVAGVSAVLPQRRLLPVGLAVAALGTVETFVRVLRDYYVTDDVSTAVERARLVAPLYLAPEAFVVLLVLWAAVVVTTCLLLARELPPAPVPRRRAALPAVAAPASR